MTCLRVAQLYVVALLIGLTACAVPRVQQPVERTIQQPRLTDKSAVMRDGYVLPLRHWQAQGETAAVVLALHGFNDYRNFFAATGRYLAGRSVTSYAYDQRGFGETAQRGVWPAGPALQDDLVSVARLLCRRHAGIPLYVFGESMGGAVAITAGERLRDTCARGVVLAAPAVWGWSTMPWWQRALLWLAAHTVPWKTVTGEDLDIRASDNVEMLRALGRDPLVIKATRIDAIHGLTGLMQAAYDGVVHLPLPVLLLYGEHDEVITPVPTCTMLEHLGDFSRYGWRMLLYPDGFHMLTRDLQGQLVMRDVAAWIDNPRASAPSGFEMIPESGRLQRLCQDPQAHPGVS